MTNNKNFFKTFNNCTNCKKVKLANGDYAEMHEIGNGFLTCRDNNDKQTTVMVKDVLYIPALEESLLSVRKLTKNGLQVQFKEKVCNIIKDASCNSDCRVK